MPGPEPAAPRRLSERLMALVWRKPAPTLADGAAAVGPLDAAGDWLFGWMSRLTGGRGALGLATGSVHFVNGLRDTPEYQFYFFRFLLGFFEGGFFPSIIVYLSLWFPA